MKKILVIHIHYLETLNTLLNYARQIRPDLVLVTHTKDIPDIPWIMKDFKEFRFHKVENRGRDIYPLVFLSELGYFERDAIVWKLHSKRSLHLLRGEIWLKELCDAIAKDSQRVAEIYSLFTQQNVSLVGSKTNAKFIRESTIEEHSVLFNRWKNLLGYSGQVLHSPYISGTIFVCHSKVLNNLRRLQLEILDFELEPLENQFDTFFALKLYVLNLLQRFRLFNHQREILDSLTRPASQQTYALEAFIGFIALQIGKIEII